MENIVGYSSVDTKDKAQRLTGMSLAKRDLQNHFAIRKGEKWTNPEFGSNLPLYVFQPLDDITERAIKDDVSAVVNYDPRFTVRDEICTVDKDAHTVTVTVLLNYQPTATATEIALKFDNEFREQL